MEKSMEFSRKPFTFFSRGLKKKGISAIVATVLTVLITVVGVTIIWVAIVPMIQNNLVSVGEEARVSIVVDGGYTAFDAEKEIASVQVKRGSDEATLARLNIIFEFEGVSETFKTSSAPDINSMRTYWFNFSEYEDLSGKSPGHVSVAPIYLKNNVEILGKVTSKIEIPLKKILLDEGEIEKAFEGNNKDVIRVKDEVSGTGPLPLVCDAGEEMYYGDCYQTIITGGVISNCWQLQNVNDVNKGGGLSGNYELINDIDCSMTSDWNGGDGFDPIGDSLARFTGDFNGRGYVVSNLYIYRRSEDYVGLFGYASGADISNVGLVGGSVDGDGNVGGLVGYQYGGKVTNSHTTGDVYGRASHVGGLVGYQRGGKVTNSYAIGNVEGRGQINGGLVGFSSSASNVTNSYATGNVDGRGNDGGLVGVNNFNSYITNSYSTGSITSSFTAGGLFGINRGSIVNSYYDNETCICTIVGSVVSCVDSGYGHFTSDLQTPSWSGFDNWDKVADWEMVSGNYPKLAWE